MGASNSSVCPKLWDQESLRLSCCTEVRDKTTGPGRDRQRKFPTNSSKLSSSFELPVSNNTDNSPRRSSSFEINQERRNSLPGLYSSKLKQPSYKLQNHLVPVWMQDPEPMTGWTQEDHKKLLSQIEEHRNARNHPQNLKNVLEKTHRAIPHKSLEEIELCFQHIQSKRIAFFGSSGKVSKK